MVKKFINYTNEIVSLDDVPSASTLIIDAYDSVDLLEFWESYEVASSNKLIEYLGQGVNKYQLYTDDGYLSVSNAIDAIRGYYVPQSFVTSNIGSLKVESVPRSGSSRTAVSHDFTDPTTWWGDSVRVENETLENPLNDGVVYRSNYKNWIDLTHGKVTQEDNIINDTINWLNGPFNIVVKVNDEVKQESMDFIVDYRSGEVLFNWKCPQYPGVIYGMGPLDGYDVVTASFNYANGSTWYLKPEVGTTLRIVKTEVQFTQDCVIYDSVIFEAWAYNPYDLPNKVPVPGTRVTYKNLRDFVAEGNDGVGTIRATGGHIKGLLNNVSVFPFDYVATKDMIGSYGAELRIWLKNSLPIGGEYGTVTAYCLIENE